MPGLGVAACLASVVSQDIQGQVPGTEIFYSIQGNILRPGEVVPHAVQAFLNAKGAITDRVMAAMEAIPCNAKTAHIAYILMAEKRDTNGDSHNNGHYAMYMTVSQATIGLSYRR